MQVKPISATRAQALLSQRAKLLTDVSKSVGGGPPIHWNSDDRAAYTAQLRSLGFNLVTKGQARALGLDIPPGTAPVGCGEFGPPLSQFLDLYILEIHATELAEELPPEAIEAASTPAKKSGRRRKKSGRGVQQSTVVLAPEPEPDLKPEPIAKRTQMKWLTTLEAADYVGKTSKAMQMMRYQHSGPPYQRNGSSVMYKSTDLDAWLASKT